jgi:hypothetical protein
MTDTLLALFVVVTGDPDDDDCEIFGPFKTERAARDVAAAGSRGEEEREAVALEAPEQGSSSNGSAVGGAIEPYFVGPFPDIATARAWAVTDGLDADAAMELVNLKPDTTGAPR